MRDLVAAAFAVLLASTPVFAQDPPSIGFNFGGGMAFPVTGLNDAFNTGWNGSIGLTFNITPEVGVQGEYMYDRLGGPDRQFDFSATPGADTQSGIIESNHQVHTGTFSLVYTPRLAANERALPIGVYVLGGGGVYHRLIQLTTPSVGFASVCNPYWYICYPTAVPVDRIIGDRSSNDFGMSFGAGVTFGGDAKFYVETRYHYVWGPKIRPEATPANGASEYSTNAGYFPVTFGVRW
jgi:opacity protein-like surface antigen